MEVVPRRATVMVAFSAGPDSVSLAHLVEEARDDLCLVLGHVRHGLRNDDRDLKVVNRHAAMLDAPLLIGEVEVRAGSRGLEAAARDARYRALRRLAADAGAGWLLVGHTADDQAETLLMRLARGTGLDGLTGIPARRQLDGLKLLRPLLRLRRADLRTFVTETGLEVVEDPMNTDRAFARVRARHDALPALDTLAGDPVGALGRLADLVRDDVRLADHLAEEHAQRIVYPYGPGRAVKSSDLDGLDVALARRVVRLLLDEVRHDAPPPDARHVTAVLALTPGTGVDVPGAWVTRGGGWVAAVTHDLPPATPATLPAPGSVYWPRAGVRLAAVRPGCEPPEQLRLPLDLPWQPAKGAVPDGALPPGADRRLGQVMVGAVPRDPPLMVRSRQPGDRVVTTVGTRKLADVLVDAKVPRAFRDLVPVVTVGSRILWVPGLAADAAAAAAGRREPGFVLTVAV